MTDDLLGYDQMMQDALRSVVRAALQQAQGPRGLPGKHHFYITFRTRAPGVSIPDHLLSRYPDEMTIVLEHQYWDLEVYPDRFRVLLKFGGAPHPLVVPFAALTRFFDPSVKFGLQFESAVEPRAAVQAATQGPAPNAAPMAQDEPAPDTRAAPVVSLDAFRKK
ncbi:MAG: ClpXP protease specificity-enhancing factor SspB [Hyphomonadaceae bacterium]|nr:ClpXP protease specificity-enhancing factor SspB [Hyphomonadaceae bacterium]